MCLYDLGLTEILLKGILAVENPLQYKMECIFMPLYLSKSKYCLGVQCPKMLWLHRHKAAEFDDSCIDEGAMETGNEVGDLAKNLFGSYVEVPYSQHHQDMLDTTRELIEQGAPVIAEATFAYRGFLCRADILKNLGGNAVELYEVKSSTGIREIYFDDVSFQCYVLSMLGYDVRRACLVHINNQYVRHGDLDLKQLFAMEDITDRVLGVQGQVQDTLDYLQSYMGQKSEPDDGIGEHCFSPYACGFFDYCARNLPNPSVFDLSGMKLSKKFKLYHEGKASFQQLKDSGVLSPRQKMQVEHELSERAPYINKRLIQEFLQGCSYPLYFLDFESFQPAVPLYENSRPYEQIPFQYSLHYIETKDGDIKHKEFLAHPGTDPRPEIAKHLCEDIPSDVCVLTYSMSFEKGRIKNLAEICPEFSDHLMAIYGNIQDLMIPFRRRDYYTKAMKGSYSIKAVLPAMFPDDPKLDYQNLDGVHNGGEASDVFKRMHHMSADEINKHREYLLKYCELDTWAMVKIWQKLQEMLAPENMDDWISEMEDSLLIAVIGLGETGDKAVEYFQKKHWPKIERKMPCKNFIHPTFMHDGNIVTTATDDGRPFDMFVIVAEFDDTEIQKKIMDVLANILKEPGNRRPSMGWRQLVIGIDINLANTWERLYEIYKKFAHVLDALFPLNASIVQKSESLYAAAFQPLEMILLMVSTPNLIGFEFYDIANVLSKSGLALFGFGESNNTVTPLREVTKQAIDSIPNEAILRGAVWKVANFKRRSNDIRRDFMGEVVDALEIMEACIPFRAFVAYGANTEFDRRELGRQAYIIASLQVK